MTKVRTKPRSNEERCAVCRDGPDGLLICRGCSTLIHASCLIDVRGCPTIGCNERDPFEAEQDRCSHDTINAVDNSCYFCGMSYKQMKRQEQSGPHRPRELPRGTIDVCPPGQCDHDMPAPTTFDPKPDTKMVDAARSFAEIEREAKNEFLACQHFFFISGGNCEGCGCTARAYFAQLNKDGSLSFTYEQWVDAGQDTEAARRSTATTKRSWLELIVDTWNRKRSPMDKFLAYVLFVALGVIVGNLILIFG